MKLIAKKPCSFGGQRFYIGDEIPAELVAEPKAQEKLGVIAIANNEGAGVSGEQSGTLYTQEQVQQTVEIIQLNAEKASAAILEVTDEGVLELLVSIDNRKTVKESAKSRLDNLSLTEGENNAAGNGNDTTEGNKEGET